MKMVYKEKYAETYKNIIRLVCGAFYQEEANIRDFVEIAIPMLPKKQQKQFVTYFGLDGGVNHAIKITRLRNERKQIDKAELDMERQARSIIRTLGTIEYVRLFHPRANELIKKIAQKTSGEPDELTATKWADLYALMIINGPFFVFDKETNVKKMSQLLFERRNSLDRVATIEEEYKSIFRHFSDGELLIPVVKGWVEDLDVQEKATVLKFFGLKIPDYLRDYEGEEISNLFELRKLKERIFSNGHWATDGYLFLRRGLQNPEEEEKLSTIFTLLRNGAKIEREDPEKFLFGTGEKEISWYKVQGEEEDFLFPSIEEVMHILPLWSRYAED